MLSEIKDGNKDVFKGLKPRDYRLVGTDDEQFYLYVFKGYGKYHVYKTIMATYPRFKYHKVFDTKECCCKYMNYWSL